MPVLPPKPPFGGMRWAASPQMNTRPSWAARDIGGGAPAGAAVDLHVEVGYADACAYEIDEAALAHIRRDVRCDLGIDIRIADRVDG